MIYMRHSNIDMSHIKLKSIKNKLYFFFHKNIIFIIY